MRLTGPDWESTRSLATAIADVAPADYTLRWGHRTHNGFEQLCAFAAADVSCPLATNSLAEAQEYIRNGKGKLWGRKLSHTQGTDIVGPGLVRRGSGQSWNRLWLSRDFWVEPIEAADEYRQHVWDGQAIRIGKKVQSGTATRVLPVRSRRNGWTIDYGASAPEELREVIRDTAKRAVQALGYVGGAVDLLVGKDGQVYALEVNTAPSLRDENTLKAYVKAITKWGKKLQKQQGGR